MFEMTPPSRSRLPTALLWLCVACSGTPDPVVPGPSPAALRGLPVQAMQQAQQRGDPAPFDEALATLRPAVLQQPDNAGLQCTLGELELNRAHFLGMAQRGTVPSTDAAVFAFERALELSPDRECALRGLAGTLLLAEQPARAQVMLERLLVHRPGDGNALFMLGRTHMLLGQFEQAATALEGACRAMERSGDAASLGTAQSMLSTALIKAGRPDEAELLLLRSVETLEQRLEHAAAPEFVVCPYTALGQLYRLRGDDAGSAEAMARAADLFSHEAFAQVEAAQAAYYAADFDRALHYADRALAMEDDEQTRALRLRIVEAQGHARSGRVPPELSFDIALRAFQDYDMVSAAAQLDLALAIERQPRFLVLRGFMHLLGSEYAEAERSFDEALERDPRQLGARIGEAHVAITRGDFEWAREQLLAALPVIDSELARVMPIPEQQTPDGWEWALYELTCLGVAWSLSNQVHHEEALEWYDRILLHQGADTFALLGRANALMAMGQLDASQDALERVLAMDPDNPYAIAELALVDLNRGDVTAAEQGFQRALEVEPVTYSCPYEGLGLVYLQQGLTEQAQQAFERAIAINPDHDFRKYNGLARIRMAEGRYDEAEALLRKSIENHPHDPAAGELLQQLERERASAPPRAP